MPLHFRERIDPPAIPSDPRQAARAAVEIAAKVDAAGGVTAAIEAGVQAIYAVAPDDPPSELKRLRLIYKDFYTDDELRRLVRTALSEYGFRE